MDAPHREVRIAPLRGAAAFAEASSLYREVFGYEETAEALNPRLLAALVENGGTAIGVRIRSGELVAFCYGFPGRRDGASYHYSQATVVAAAFQGRGLGRALKSAQREAARRDGTTRMRWAFDPARVANAHFNLDVLGARGRWAVGDLYGLAQPSPRMIVEWDFDDPPRHSPTPPAGREEARVAGADRLEWVRFEPAHGAACLVERLSPLLEGGYSAESCASEGGVGWYALRATEPDIRRRA